MSQRKFAISKPHKSKKRGGRGGRGGGRGGRGGGRGIEIPETITYRPLLCDDADNSFLDILNKISNYTEIILINQRKEFVFEEFELPDSAEEKLMKARQIMTDPNGENEVNMYLIFVKMTKLSYMLHALEHEKDKGVIYWSLSSLGNFKLSENKKDVLFFVDDMLMKCDILKRIFTNALRKILERMSILRDISENESFTWPNYIYYEPFVMSCQLSNHNHNNKIMTTLNQYHKQVEVMYVHENKFKMYPWPKSMKKLSPKENDEYVAVVKISYVRWLLGEGMFENGIEDWVVLYLLEAVGALKVHHNDKVVLTLTTTNMACVFDHILDKFASYLIPQILAKQKRTIQDQVRETRTFEWPETMTYRPFSVYSMSCLRNPEKSQTILNALQKQTNIDNRDKMYLYVKLSNVLLWLEELKNSKMVYDILKCVARIYVDPTTQKLVVRDTFNLFEMTVWKDILLKHTKNIMGILKKEVLQQAAQKKDVLARLLAQQSFEWPRQITYHHPVTFDCITEFQDEHKFDQINKLQCIVSLEEQNDDIKPDIPVLYYDKSTRETFVETIKISYLLWLLQDVKESRAVYELLKLQFIIHLNPNNAQKLIFTEQNGTGDICLFKNIIDTHEKNIVDILNNILVQQQKEKEDILEAVRNKRAFVWPSVIPSKPFRCDDMFFDLLNTGMYVLENDVIKPKFSLPLKKTFKFKFAIKMSYICWLLQDETDFQVVYTLLKYVVAMSVDPSTNELILKGDFADCLSQFLRDPVKEYIKKLLLQKKQARMTLLTKVPPRLAQTNSEMAMESLYVCGQGKEDCVPIKNSDVLLSFLNSEKYTNIVFHETIFKTLQTMYPNACFLHDINIEWYNANDNSYVTKDEFFNDTRVVSKYVINTHLGRNTEKTNTLSFEQYKRDQIDACLARVGNVGNVGNVGGLKPLIAIPVGIPGHANMLIIDLNKKEVEHFEPHGDKKDEITRSTMQNQIETDFRHISAQLFPTCTYIPRSNATNFQSVLNDKFENSIHGGTCAMWSIWYAYLRLSHPEFDREVILKQSRALLEKDDFSELERFIIKFMQQLNSLVGMYQVGDKYYTGNGRVVK